MKTSGIYKIINNVNGKYYIGSSRNIEGSKGRWGTHKYMLKYNKHFNQHLQNAWNLYGPDSFQFLLVEELKNATDTELKTLEQRYLDIAKSFPENSYNLTFDAFNKTLSEETKQKISKSNMGRVMSEEAKKRISIAHKGKKHTPEQIAKFVKAKTGSSWGHHTEETKRKMSLVHSGINGERYDHTKRQWFNTETKEKFFGTQYEFCNTYNLKRTSVNLVVKGHRNSLFGWKILCV